MPSDGQGIWTSYCDVLRRTSNGLYRSAGLEESADMEAAARVL